MWLRSIPQGSRPALRGPLLAAVVAHLVLLAGLFLHARRQPDATVPAQPIEISVVASPAAPAIPSAPALVPAPDPASPVTPDTSEAAPVPIAPSPSPVPEAVSPPPPLAVPLAPPVSPARNLRPSRPRRAALPDRQTPRAGLSEQNAAAPASAPAAEAPAPSVRPTPTAADVSGGWQRALAAWLQAHKTYPEAARRDGIEGRVIVQFNVDRAGAVREVAVVRSSGSPELDDAAAAMLRGARLPPPPPSSADTLSLTLPIRYSLGP